MGKGDLSMREDIEQITSAVRVELERALAEREATRAPLDERVAAFRVSRLAAERARAHRVWAAAGAALAVAAGALLFLRGPRSPERTVLSFTVGDGAGELGAPIAPSTSAVPLRFSDGSEIDLHAASTIRVASTTTSGAEVVLERGTIRTHVVPRAGNRWTIAAGPYRVQVKGTRFDTEWDPATQRLRVTMQEGRVLVTGGCLDGARELGAGDVSEMSCPVTAATPREAPPPDGDGNGASASPPSAAAAAASVAARSSRSAELPAAIAPPSPERRAAPASVEDVITSGTAEETMGLAETSRHAGRFDTAERAYRAVRARFSGSSHAATATFLLARMLADDRRGAEAEPLFLEYTRLAPNGAFAEEAWGRLVELARASGDVALARSRARFYVDSFPNGASVDVARDLLAK
ncbi:MAG: FecR domain-containing protein [Labilithrix sp.]|nr:FecR domain-containing protein [Labilithrix sp.]